MTHPFFRAVLTAIALVVSLGISANAQSLTCHVNAGVPPFVRAEGVAELVGDVYLICTGGTPTPVGSAVPLSNITISLNTNITSRIVGPASNASEAVLTIDEPFPGNPNPPDGPKLAGSAPQGYCAVNAGSGSLSACGIVGTGGGIGVTGPYKAINIFQGQQVSASSVAWLGIPLDAPGNSLVRFLHITNVRANACQLNVSSTLIPVQIAMTVQMSGAQQATVTNPQQAVAFIQPGLVVGGSSKMEQQCKSLNNTLVGGSTNTTQDGPTFASAQEGFSTAFKARGYATRLSNAVVGTPSPTLQNVPGFTYNTESGFVSTVTGGATTGQTGVADSGTRIMLSFSGVGTGVSLFVPNFIPLVLSGSCATDFLSGCVGSGGLAVLVSGTDANGSGGSLFSGATNLNAQLCTSSTSLCAADATAVTNNIAVYEVVQANPFTVEQLVVPVSPAYISAGSQPGLGQITITTQFAPQSTISTASSSAPLPRFCPGPAARNFIGIISCNSSAAILSVQKTHAGNFAPSQQNATYQVTVSNANGAGPSNGTVTVTENLPSGLQLVSMSGAGWACNSNSCTRSDVLNGGASYPSITVTVNVAANASSPQVNAVSVSGGGSAPANTIDSTVIATGQPAGLQFVPVTPCRVMDTRNANGLLGGPFLAASISRAVPILSSPCGIPSSAQAYSLNITVVPRTSTLGFLTVWPAGQSQPAVSTLNSPDGSVLANAAIVPAGTGGFINVFATNDTDVVIDIDGYFTPPAATSLQFYPLSSCRVLDTRNANGIFGGPFLASASTRTFPIGSSACSVPASAQAYSFNVTAVPRGPLGFLTAWPSGQPQPGVSTLNSQDGTVLANAAIVPAGTGGSVSFFASNATDLVLDINGYFAPPGPGGLNFYTVAPCRVADTRNAIGSLGGPIMATATTRTFPVPSSACGLPAAAAAYSLNMTVVPQGPLGFLTTWPTGQAQPTVSTLNGLKGIVIANAAIVPAGSGGAINVFVSNTTHVIIDANGYFQ